MTYDKNNIFAKILRGEIPCKKVFEKSLISKKYLFTLETINLPSFQSFHLQIYDSVNEELLAHHQCQY